MYAVVATGGKQYKVAEGDVIKVEKLAGEPGDIIKLEDVLAYNDGSVLKIGADASKQAVSAEVIAQQKGEKVTIFKKKRRQNYRRTKGHRQHETVLRIASLTGEAKKAAPKKKEADAKETKTEKKPAAKTAAKKSEDK